MAVDNHGQDVAFDPAPGTASAPVDGRRHGPTALTAVSCSSDDSQCTAVDRQGNEMTFVPGGTGTSLPAWTG